MKKSAVVVNTRPGEAGRRFSHLLKEQGRNVLDLPLLSLVPLTLGGGEERLVDELFLEKFDLVVFGSVNSVEFFVQAPLAQGRQLPKNLLIAAQGPATAESLAQRFPDSSFLTPQRDYSQEGLCLALQSRVKELRRVLLVSAAGGRTVLAEFLRAHDIEVFHLKLYQTVVTPLSGDTLLKIKSVPSDIMYFPVFSPSAAKALSGIFENVPELKVRSHFVAVGEVTYASLKKQGLQAAVAKEASVESVLQTIKDLEALL